MKAARYQLAVTTPDRCAQGFQQGAGEFTVELPRPFDMVRCDAQELARVADHAGGQHLLIPPALRRRVMRDAYSGSMCGFRMPVTERFLDVHHLISHARNAALILSII